MRKEEQGIQEKVMQSRSLKSRSNFTAVPNELIKCYDLSRAAKMLWIELFS